MTEEWIKLKERWKVLSLREKQVITAGAAILFVLMIYQFVWTPFLAHNALMRKRIAVEQKNLVWMQSADKVMQQLEGQEKAKKEALTPVVLMSAMQKIINRAGYAQYLTQLKQSGNDSIEMQFQKIEFDKLMTLLMMSINQQRAIITQASMTAETTPGLVSAIVIVKAG